MAVSRLAQPIDFCIDFFSFFFHFTKKKKKSFSRHSGSVIFFPPSETNGQALTVLLYEMGGCAGGGTGKYRMKGGEAQAREEDDEWREETKV